MKLYVLKLPVKTCTDCPNVIGPSVTGNGWRCRVVRDQDGDFRTVSQDELQVFPVWCPLADITWGEFDKRLRG